MLARLTHNHTVHTDVDLHDLSCVLIIYAVLVWAAMSHNHIVYMDMDFHEVSCVTIRYAVLAVLKTLTLNHIVRMDMYIHDLSLCVSLEVLLMRIHGYTDDTWKLHVMRLDIPNKMEIRIWIILWVMKRCHCWK